MHIFSLPREAVNNSIVLFLGDFHALIMTYRCESVN
jgi:hypothetical protein